MKRFAMAAIAAVVVSVSALPVPVLAQQSIVTPPLANESALDYARRVDACHGADAVSAEFLDNLTRLRVSCPGTVVTNTEGMSGGLGAAAAAAGGLIVILFALGGSSNTPTLSTSTTGTGS